MHREISHTDEAFAEESNLPLYLMTGLLAVLLALDLLPHSAIGLAGRSCNSARAIWGPLSASASLSP